MIAADTQVTMGQYKFTSDPKILTLDNGVVLACAGDAAKGIQAKKFFSQPDWEDKLDDAPNFKKGFEALVISKGRIYYCVNDCIAIPLGHKFHAMGSGWVLAAAAMHMGLSAIEAVKFASELDIHTNSEVVSLNVEDLLQEAGTKRAGRSVKRKAVP